jgi:hypothetical protein
MRVAVWNADDGVRKDALAKDRDAAAEAIVVDAVVLTLESKVSFD